MQYYNPPTNHDAFNRYYRERQVSIRVSNKLTEDICGKNKANLKMLQKKYNISISAINIWKWNEVEYLFTHNKWLKLDDPKNLIQLCRLEFYSLEEKAKFNLKEKTTYGCNSCIKYRRELTLAYVFKDDCSICKKRRGCRDCKNEDGTYDNLCEYCGRSNCCPTCLNIDGTVNQKCGCCKRR